VGQVPQAGSAGGDDYIEMYTIIYVQELVKAKKHDEDVAMPAKYSQSVKSQTIPA
jgi:hypothetical protein